MRSIPKKAPEVKNKPSRLRLTPAKQLFLGISLFILFSLSSIAAYSFVYVGKILPHTYIGGVSVGGQDKVEAAGILAEKEQVFLEQPLTIQYQEKKWEIRPSEIDIQFHNQESVETAFTRGKDGSFLEQIGALLKAMVVRHYLEVDLISFSEKSREALTKKVLAEIESPSAETSLEFIPGKVSVIAGKTGRKLDYNRFETELYKAFKSGSLVVGIELVDFEPEVSVEQAGIAKKTAESILAAPWKLKTENQEFSFEPKEVANWLTTKVEYDAQGKAIGLGLTVKPEPLKKSVDILVAKAEKTPINAKLRAENGTIVVVEESKNGLKMVGDKTVAAIASALESYQLTKAERVITAVTDIVQADLRRDNVGDLGIKEMIGSATTDYSGSPNNRKFNIAVGQRSLSGQLVKRGETFSTTAGLGPVNESTGYLPELVIKDNRTIPESGGGLCQVSTTFFRAVLKAGLPVLERTNHAYRVGYYERGVGAGLDATVYIPNPDFKWKNDTDHAIYIQTYVRDNKITFELYGTNDGRISKVDGPYMLEEIPVGEPINQETDTLFKDEKKQIETAHNGAKTIATYIVTRNGQEINRQVFRSYYRPWPAQYLVGTKERPNPG